MNSNDVVAGVLGDENISQPQEIEIPFWNGDWDNVNIPDHKLGASPPKISPWRRPSNGNSRWDVTHPVK